MKLHTIKTGSQGNCYILEDNNEFLIIEAGASFNEVISYIYRKKDDLKFSGIIITHEHGDHAKFTEDFASLGIPVYMSSGTHDECLISNYIKSNQNLTEIKKGELYNVGNYLIMPIASDHDANEPLNFIIRKNDKTIVFITDTAELDYNFNFKIDCLICEVNYSVNKIENNIEEGFLHPNLYLRIVNNHLSDEQLNDYLEKHHEKIKMLVPIHLSKSNIDGKNLSSNIIKNFGIVTKIAENKSEIYI